MICIVRSIIRVPSENSGNLRYSFDLRDVNGNSFIVTTPDDPHFAVNFNPSCIILNKTKVKVQIYNKTIRTMTILGPVK